MLPACLFALNLLFLRRPARQREAAQSVYEQVGEGDLEELTPRTRNIIQAIDGELNTRSLSTRTEGICQAIDGELSPTFSAAANRDKKRRLTDDTADTRQR